MKYSKNELEKLILEQNKSYSFIGQQYGVSGAAIKKAALKLGIPLQRRRKINENENFSHKGFRKNSNVFNKSDSDFREIIATSSTWGEIAIKLGYKEKISSNVKEAIEMRCSMLGIELQKQFYETNYVGDKTKKELFESRSNWQSARSAIQKNARSIFFENNPNAICAICGYDKHIEVAHIKAVSEFNDDTPIKDINSINNLIGLCPNHHWEYDNGILKI